MSVPGQYRPGPAELRKDRRMKKLLSLILVPVLLFTLIGCEKAAPSPAAPAAAPQTAAPQVPSQKKPAAEKAKKNVPEHTSGELLRALIKSYDPAAGIEAPETQELLAELALLDADKAALWSEILDYWTYVNTEMPLNIGGLPEGLPDDDSLAIVVLGYELKPDGAMQPELKGRLRTALACAKQYPNAYVVCTGGGTARKNKSVTEAGLMAEWLINHGVKPRRLIVEDRSRSTVENALFTYDILREAYPQVDSLAIVSSSYHIPWGALLFEAELLKEAAESGAGEICVISNAAYETGNDKYSDVLGYQRSGLLQLTA